MTDSGRGPASATTTNPPSSERPGSAELLVQIMHGPDAGMVRVVDGDGAAIQIGRATDCHVRLTDREVSHRHVAISIEPAGYRVRDLGSTNGTFVDGVRITDAMFEDRAHLRVGRTALTLARAPAADADEPFRHLLGDSPPMRELKALCAQIARSDSTVLITGETGTGKEVIAEAIHGASPRRRGPFVVIDCSAIPAGVFEAELFGHERGAFTGAVGAAPGLFERADRGTVLLDEIGELPLELQPKLLRAVQTRTIRRVGGDRVIACDVRVIAATNRALRAEVERGAFRADLYYRIAVAYVHAPPLRDRPGDVELLARHFARQGGGALDDDQLAELARRSWPGNVRELRNAVERALCMPDAPAEARPRSLTLELDPAVPFKAARQTAMDEVDRRFVSDLLDAHDWNIAAAARAAGLDRVTIYRMIQRLGLRRDQRGDQRGDR